MKIGSSGNLWKKGLKPGDEVWACAFRFASDKESMRFVQKPVRGILALAKTEVRHNALMKETHEYASYFVPYGIKGKLSWSKAVETSSRRYATTEEECIELYNSLIDDVLLRLREQYMEVENERII